MHQAECKSEASPYLPLRSRAGGTAASLLPLVMEDFMWRIALYPHQPDSALSSSLTLRPLHITPSGIPSRTISSRLLLHLARRTRAPLFGLVTHTYPFLSIAGALFMLVWSINPGSFAAL